MISVVVAGGGTAGHIEPALAVADALGTQAHVTALGTSRGLETELVPERGYELSLINPVPVPRKPNKDLLLLPFRVLKAVRSTRKILKKTKADAVIGFGGYVSAPAYIAARTLGIPFFVHEANARAGMANKLGVFLGGIGLNAVAGSGMKGDVVGVPIRASLAADDPKATAEHRAKACDYWGLDPNKPTVLVTGGSQGARSINDAVAIAAPKLSAAGIQVLHAYGKKNTSPEPADGYVPVPYIAHMDWAYAIADVVVCRAGAMTVAEVTAAGKPAIYIPLPHGNGEQALNASSVIEAGGATLIKDSDLTGEALATQIQAIIGDKEIYSSMVDATKRSNLGRAAEDIASRILRKVS